LGESHQLINISSGVVADSRVNVDDSFKIGMDINNGIAGVKFDDIKFKRNDQAVLFSVMRKSLKLSDGNVYMSSLEIQQCLLRLANRKGTLY
jgi:hypothetical protein